MKARITWLLCFLFIHSFNKYLLNISHVPDNVLGNGNTSINKTDIKIPIPFGTYVLERETDNKQSKQNTQKVISWQWEGTQFKIG